MTTVVCCFVARMHPNLQCDWSKHNKHSRNISGVHGFLSLTVKKETNKQTNTVGCKLHVSEKVHGAQTNSQCRIQFRLFTVPYFTVKLLRSIVEFECSPSWFLYASETWGEYKMPVGRGAGC